MAASRKNEIASAIPSGVARMTPYILGSWVFLTAVYFVLFFTFRESRNILWLPPPDDEFCRDYDPDQVCSRSDLFAFEMTCLISLALCGCLGFWTWHANQRAHTALPSTPEGRLFGYLKEGEFLAATSVSFQLWDFGVSLFIPEYRTAIMLTHHVMAFTVSWCSIRYTVLHFYGIFFLGLSEVSSIFLIFVGLAKYFPPEPGTMYNYFVAWLWGPAFAVTFTYYRVILWWPISYQLFQDVRAVIRSEQAAKLRPGKAWVLYIFLALNLPLGILQLYWVTLILDGAKKILTGEQL